MIEGIRKDDLEARSHISKKQRKYLIDQNVGYYEVEPEHNRDVEYIDEIDRSE